MMRLVVSVLALSMLAGCGIKGGLERPDPMWNSDEAIARECARQEEARSRSTMRPPPVDPRCTQQGQQSPQ
jgi:predicted small lipoprotein YifL